MRSWLPLLVFTACAAHLSVAQAGTLYVNGVRADGLRDFEFNQVNVRIDAQGNVWVDAPRYQVEVDQVASAQQSYAPQTNQNYRTASAVVGGRYWLVTEDNSSVGQNLDVVINGNLAHKIRSGEGQVIMDLGPYLRQGPNTIIFNASSPGGGGGALVIYVGTGQNQQGTVVLDEPLVTHRRAGNDTQTGPSRTYQINVP
jgi:hypothetical protein